MYWLAYAHGIERRCLYRHWNINNDNIDLNVIDLFIDQPYTLYPIISNKNRCNLYYLTTVLHWRSVAQGGGVAYYKNPKLKKPTFWHVPTININYFSIVEDEQRYHLMGVIEDVTGRDRFVWFRGAYGAPFVITPGFSLMRIIC